ncbi:MAG: MFS transporter [Acidobacteriaceae bacterium]|nr:MFS transporter [Acidobacteriaceae bacterium]
MYDAASEPSSAIGLPRVGYRWRICALLFFATVIAYIDRGVIGYLEKFLEKEIGWNSIQYSYITTAFQIAYAIGLATAGRLTDRLGTRKGFAFAITLWSVAAMLPAVAYSVETFAIAMFILGLGEAANFPACIKTIAEWFPRKERAFATGTFNSGANVGNIVVPIVVPFLTAELGWRGAFVGTGALGFIWLAFWLVMYAKPHEHQGVSPAELAHIQSDPGERTGSVPLMRILPRKEAWAFAIGKFLTDPIWWFYLFWLPRYLQGTFHLNLSQSRTPIIAVYTISCAGSVLGGWLSALFAKRGFSANASRKFALLSCALPVVPIIYAPYTQSLWMVVLLVGIAAAAHQGWSANLYTITSDTFPKSAVATVVGFGGMIGALGGALFQLATGRIVAATNSYIPLFLMACIAYLAALGIIQLLSPSLKPARLD